MANPDTDGLKIGDLVSLKSPKWEAFLDTEGILLEELTLSIQETDFDDCIFAVHLQRQYSASRELESFLETYASNIKSGMDDSMKQYLKALERGRDNEIRLNDVYMNNKLGQAVNFGDFIQLYHVKSRKYLVTNPKILAYAERENSKVGLSASGNINSWLQFMPRFKIDREGDRILSGAELYMRIAERPNEYIHAAEKNPRDKREVNCSMEKSSWRINVYQSANYLTLENAVLASQLVYIHDAETRSNITISREQLETLDSPDDDEHQVEEIGDDDEVKEKNIYRHEFGDIVLQPMGGDNAIDSRSVWSLESVSGVDGGPITWKSEHCRFKNLSSGLYLLQKKMKQRNAETGDVIEKIIFTTTKDTSKAGTLFHFFESNSTSKYLSKGKALQIASGPQWICRGDHEGLDFQLKSTLDKAEAVSLLINDYEQFSVDETSGNGSSAR